MLYMLRLAGLVHEHLADLELPVHDVFLQQGTASTWSAHGGTRTARGQHTGMHDVFLQQGTASTWSAHGRHTDSTYYSNT